jgi:HSP20 family protein
MLTAWDPVRLLDRMVDDVMNGSFGTATNAKSFVPQVDVRSNDDRVVFYFDVPGVKKEDLEITLERGVLTVKGARQFEAGNAKEQLLLGRAYGSFNRSFSLPDNLDEEKLTAKLTDGVLAVEIPRQKKAKPRRIEINGSRPSESDEKK